MNDDLRAIVRYFAQPLNVVKWIATITVAALAVIFVLWVAAQAWQSS